MSDKLKEFYEESIAKILKSLTAEKRLEGLSAEEVGKALSPEKRQELARWLKSNGQSEKPDASSDPPPRA